MYIAKLFSSKDRKYNDNYDESYVEFADQYFSGSLALCLSPLERLQYLHNLAHGDALRFYNANFAGPAQRFPEALQMMKKRFKSARKQQQVKAELCKLSYVNVLGRTGGNKRKRVKELKKHIEKRIPLRPGT